MYLEFIQAFVLLIVIMDPLVSMLAFLSMTKNLKDAERNIVVIKAVLVAAIPLFLSILFGNLLLEIMRVNMSTFKAAGGLILVLLGIQLSLGVSFRKKEEEIHDIGAIAAVIGTPLITGPATISAAILLTNEIGSMITAMAGITALIIVFIALRLCSTLHTFLGSTGIRVLSTMMGLITVAWGISFIKEGFFV
jgi:multiple antibiotic resistance protein